MLVSCLEQKFKIFEILIILTLLKLKPLPKCLCLKDFAMQNKRFSYNMTVKFTFIETKEYIELKEWSNKKIR